MPPSRPWSWSAIFFRQSMRRLAAAVSIVACESDGEWFDLGATSVTSLLGEDVDPPIYCNGTYQ